MLRVDRRTALRDGFAVRWIAGHVAGDELPVRHGQDARLRYGLSARLTGLGVDEGNGNVRQAQIDELKEDVVRVGEAGGPVAAGGEEGGWVVGGAEEEGDHSVGWGVGDGVVG